MSTTADSVDVYPGLKPPTNALPRTRTSISAKPSSAIAVPTSATNRSGRSENEMIASNAILSRRRKE